MWLNSKAYKLRNTCICTCVHFEMRKNNYDVYTLIEHPSSM